MYPPLLSMTTVWVGGELSDDNIGVQHQICDKIPKDEIHSSYRQAIQKILCRGLLLECHVPRKETWAGGEVVICRKEGFT